MLKKHLKKKLPSFIRCPLRASLNYFQRIGRWGIILWQVKGQRFSDKKNLFLSAFLSPVLSLQNLMSWQDPILLFDTNVQVTGIGRFELRNHTDDLWHVLPWHERAVLKAHRMYLHYGDTYIDAGANIGFFTLLASRLVGDSGQVIAFEMMPDTAEILRHNLALNNLHNVKVIEKALYNSYGRTIVAKVNKEHYGQASIIPSINAGSDREVEVKTTTLARELKDLSQIALLKVDIEGAELMAFEGAGATLSRIGVILYEQWTEENQHINITKYLQRSGFNVTSIDGRNQVAVKNP